MSGRRVKWARILEYLAAGNSLNRFEAEKLGDHSLPSTISGLKHRHGIFVEHTPEIINGYYGAEVRCMRYSLAATERERAKALLESLAK